MLGTARRAGAAAASASLAGTELVRVAVPDPHGLFAVLLADVVHVLAHLATEVVNLVVEAVPGGLAADADRVADGLPCSAVGDGFLHELGLPRRQLGLQRPGGAEGLE